MIGGLAVDGQGDEVEIAGVRLQAKGAGDLVSESPAINARF